MGLKHWSRLDNIISLLEDNREMMLDYFLTNNFNYTNFNHEDNNHISDKVLYYDYRFPNVVIDNPIISQICSYNYVTYCSLTEFPPGLHIKEHLDPTPADKIYQETQSHYFFEGDQDYRRIHFSIQDSGDDCYMTYQNRKVTWKSGDCQVFDVYRNPHEFFNNTDKMFSLFLIDVIVGDGRITCPYQSAP